MRKICPAGVFESIDKKHPPQIKFLNSCIACGHCEAVCKHNAVISEPFLKIGCTTEIGDSFDSLLSSLRSVRNYKSQAISHQDFKTIVQSGYNVPTAQNIRKINIATYNDIEIKGIHDVIVKKLTTTKIVIPLLTTIIGVFDKKRQRPI